MTPFSMTLEMVGKQVSPRGEHGGTRVQSSNGGPPLLFASQDKEPIMATSDKARNTAQQAKGKLKETVGKVSGNDKLRAKGKADQVKGDIKQAGEKLKDAFKK